jgi:2-polyprenyl-6-methoxyphenol hydroxylase-like FAD-dependent oxidoreductase
MNWPTVQIVGNGFASCAAALALRTRGIPVAFECSSSPPSGPSQCLVLDETAIRLVRDQFGVEMFQGAHQLRVRSVKWGSEDRRVFEPALAVRRSTLLERMERSVGTAGYGSRRPSASPDWSLFAARGAAPASRSETRYGRRVALSCEIAVPNLPDPSNSRVEVIDTAWLYCFPIGDNRACLQVTIPDSPDLPPDRFMANILQKSRFLCDLVHGIDTPVSVLDSAPAVSRPLTGMHWISIGSAAVRFDPLCGDGTAQSMRTGLLAAAAVMLAISRNMPTQAVEHYAQRVEGTVGAHLRACSAFYGTAGFGASWKDELSRIETAGTTSARVDPSALDFAFRDGTLVEAHRH